MKYHDLFVIFEKAAKIQVLIEHSVSKQWKRWLSTVCLCPTKRTLGIYGLNRASSYCQFWREKKLLRMYIITIKIFSR